jgi:hypothetical protein
MSKWFTQAPLALKAAQSVITDIVAKQSDRSVFPHSFPLMPSDSLASSIGTEALLPLQLPKAVSKLKAHLVDITKNHADQNPICLLPPKSRTRQ